MGAIFDVVPLFMGKVSPAISSLGPQGPTIHHSFTAEASYMAPGDGTGLYCAVRHYVVLHYAVMCCTVLHYAVLCCTVLHYAVMCCSVLHH